MKLLRYNLPPIQLPSEVVLNVDYHSPNVLEVTTTENTVELGYCLKFEENEPRPLNIACYNSIVGEWFLDPNKVDRIVAKSNNLRIYFKDGKFNIFDYSKFC